MTSIISICFNPSLFNAIDVYSMQLLFHSMQLPFHSMQLLSIQLPANQPIYHSFIKQEDVLFQINQMYGTFFFITSSNSEVFGPFAVWMILPCRQIKILGLQFDANSAIPNDSTFSWSNKIISTLFSNSSITVVCKFL